MTLGIIVLLNMGCERQEREREQKEKDITTHLQRVSALNTYGRLVLDVAGETGLDPTLPNPEVHQHGEYVNESQHPETETHDRVVCRPAFSSGDPWRPACAERHAGFEHGTLGVGAANLEQEQGVLKLPPLAFVAQPLKERPVAVLVEGKQLSLAARDLNPALGAQVLGPVHAAPKWVDGCCA